MPSRFEFRSEHDAALRYFYVPAVPRPPAVQTQWVSFRFRSEGMVRHSPGSHFAIVLAAELGFAEDGRPITISGRGMTLGDTSAAWAPPDNPHAAAPGFGGARGAQIESFWTTGNFIYREHRLLDRGLADATNYHVHLHVNAGRWIAFWILGDDGRPLDPRGHTCVQDRVEHPVTPDRTGLLIALGRGDVETGPWSAVFDELVWGWF